MTAKLHHTLVPIAAMAATTAAANYPASNVTNPSCGRPWRSTAITTQNLDIDLGTSKVAPVLCIQGPNAASCVVSYGTAAYTTTNLGTQNLALDRHGRRKHSIVLGNARFIRLVFGAAAPDDDAQFFSVGAVFIFSATLTLPAEPLLGSEANPTIPQTLVQIPNGNEYAIERGQARQRIALRFRGLRTTDLDDLTRRARRAPCWLDLEVAGNRELQWPVRHQAAEMNRNFARAMQDDAQIPLVEIA
jgi:hypothetical protein